MNRFFLFFFICSHSLLAEIRLPKILSDGVVLQREKPVKLRGWESASVEVQVMFSDVLFKTRADESGYWLVELPAQPAGGPHSIAFFGTDTVHLANVLFGDVWLCSGQSNMELTMDRVKYKYPEELKTANNPNIRQFEVPDRYAFKGPQPDLQGGQWASVTPQMISRFSAVAYFYATELYQKYEVPIGLVNAALGGSPAEAWMSEEALVSFPNYHQELQLFKNDDHVSRIEKADKTRSDAWFSTVKSGDVGVKEGWKIAEFDHTKWDKMEVPGYWADGPLGNVNGVVWFRKEFDLPADFDLGPALLELGRIVDADSVFFNGEFVGYTSYQYPPRQYKLGPNILKSGRNVLAVKVINQSGRGGFVLDKPYLLSNGSDTLSLAGSYSYKLGYAAPPLAGSTVIRWKPGGLYNGMIAPISNFSFKGVIWYQGESNTKAPKEYFGLMSALILDWRGIWGSNLPFLYVQLANFMEPTFEPVESDWAELRHAQLQCLSIPFTGMAVTIDLGEWNDIHPLNKREVGRRLALQARTVAYGETGLVASGPIYDQVTAKKKRVEVTFSNSGSSLLVRGNASLSGFELAGADRKFKKATATLKDDKVVLTSPEISKPMFVRYAWANNPVEANLFNSEGLPASPFEAEIGKNMGSRPRENK